MPAASATARTQFTHSALFSRRYLSFAGKAEAVVDVGGYTYSATWQAVSTYAATSQATRTDDAEWSTTGTYSAEWD